MPRTYLVNIPDFFRAYLVSIGLKDVIPIILKHLNAKPKKIYDFHKSQATKHIEELKNTGSTSLSSPFIRKLIYAELDRQNVKYKTKITGYSSDLKSCYDWRLMYNPKLIMHYLNKGCYNLKDIQNKYPDYYFNDISEEDLNKLFDRRISKKEKYEIIVAFSKKINKWHIFENPRKPIKTFYLIT